MNTSYQLNKQSKNFLTQDEILVYIENRQPFADTDGYTHIARFIKSYIVDDKLWYDVKLITDAEGDRVNNRHTITISGENVVSNRSFHDIQPRSIIHVTPLLLSQDVEYPVTATGFVLKKNLNRPLTSTSRSALGSGIYGKYVDNTAEELSLRVSNEQSEYIIDCSNAYIVQDKEHGESITVASLHTNRYLDRIISSLQNNKEVTLADVKSHIRMNSSANLSTLWNIVFYRTQEQITQDWLEDIFAEYVMKYLQDNTLIDSIDGETIQELPINHIIMRLGYNGLLASDPYNNGWDRGSVSYDYSQADILQGSTARY